MQEQQDKHPLSVYNTLSQQVEVLKPIQKGKINLFVCGPTVYDYSHLGHAKTYTQFDFIVKYLRHYGYDVFYLQNITDIDDKIIQRSTENKEPWKKLARRFEEVYMEDMKALHIDSITQYARATDSIENITKQVQKLLQGGYAYKTEDGIYYEIAKFPSYGKLSKRTKIQQDDSVARIDVSNHKKGWNDFCLWKFSKPGEPVWETPLGAGRPGWHIEDTAITEKYFGSQYDIHGGAVDLIFPHHEAEIAQMEAASGKEPLVRYWMHTGFLNTNAQKMSKSLGNFKTIRETLQTFNYRVLRYLFISAHYRSSLDFTPTTLEQAKNALQRIDEFVFKIDATYDDTKDTQGIAEVQSSIYEALNNDFNTPQAFAALFEFVRTQNVKKKIGIRTFKLLHEINAFMDIMNLDIPTRDEYIESLIQERNLLRGKKNFARADVLRKQLQRMGVKIYDTEEGTRYHMEKNESHP